MKVGKTVLFLLGLLSVALVESATPDSQGQALTEKAFTPGTSLFGGDF